MYFDDTDGKVAWGQAIAKGTFSKVNKVVWHTSYYFPHLPGTNNEWERLVYEMGERWKKTLLKWWGSAHQHNISVLVVRYEDLKEDKVEQVSRMLDFLHHDYNRTELATRLEAGFDEFHRQHTADDYDHYTQDQRTYVKSVITSTAEQLKLMGGDELLWIYDYL